MHYSIKLAKQNARVQANAELDFYFEKALKLLDSVPKDNPRSEELRIEKENLLEVKKSLQAQKEQQEKETSRKFVRKVRGTPGKSLDSAVMESLSKGKNNLSQSIDQPARKGSLRATTKETNNRIIDAAKNKNLQSALQSIKMSSAAVLPGFEEKRN